MLLYDAAKKAHNENIEVDYNDPVSLGDYSTLFLLPLEMTPKLPGSLRHLCTLFSLE